MQFPSRRRKQTSNPQTELYAHPLQFYGEPPLENMSLAEFETFAVDRLKCKEAYKWWKLQKAVFCVLLWHTVFNGRDIYMSFLNSTAVLKTVENLGVSYVKLSEPYAKKLESEFKNLSFPYRPEAVSMFSMTCVTKLEIDLLWT